MTTSTTMTKRRLATAAAALTLIAALGLSACGGDSSGIPDGVYVEQDDADDSGYVQDLIIVHDGQITGVHHTGSSSGADLSTAESCNTYKKFHSDAEKNSINPEGVENVYGEPDIGKINDAGDTIIWETGRNGGNPEPIVADSPDTGMITIDSDERDGGHAEIYVPISDPGAEQGVERSMARECSDD